jgi:hypothetical protein
MPDHDFEHLDDKNFERLATGLCTEYIARGLRIFGSGTDGGREATFEGKMNYPSTTAPWDGYLVVQCKQKQSRGTPKEEAAWAISQLDAEMAKYKTAKKPRRIPAYFLFITNAHLSAQQGTGGKDKFMERLQYWGAELGMKATDVWDRDKLNNLVNLTPKIAQRFGLLHSGNLIHYAAHAFLAHQEGIETTLSIFLQEELRADQFVQLAQAGHANDDRTPLARVFVDLRAVDAASPQQSFYVVNAIQEISDRPVHPSLLKEEQEQDIAYQISVYESGSYIDRDEWNPELAGWSVEEDPEDYEEEELEDYEEVSKKVEFLTSVSPSLWPEPSRFVIVGGPGQGKSTLGQQLAQRHRAALLKASASKTLESETSQIIRVIESAADEIGTGLPNYPRWPFRVILEDFAGALAKGEVVSVLDYIASLVRRRTKRAFTQQDAEVLLTKMPWFVAFDGLDEVPAVSNRAEVLDAVRRFLLEARDKDADLLVIATTRPQGYQDEFKQFKFNELTLQLLVPDEALAYAQKFVDVKYAADAIRRGKIMERLQAAAREDATIRLMSSPLQVTIMAALVELIGILPRERYSLFERYYEIIYQREQERGSIFSTVLAEHRTTIEILHDRIGLLLQVEAESKGKTESRISGERLTQMVYDYLVQKEFEGEELSQLTTTFVKAAVYRLVFVVPLEDNRYGFEVRSLQEFSAARALMRGDYSIVKNRLRAIAPVSYWRNTMLFAIGQAFAKQNEQQCDMVMQLCHELNDSSDHLLSGTLAGSKLALDVLEDGIVELQPSYRKQFVMVALNALQLPHEVTAMRLVNLYTGREDAQYKKYIQSAVSSSEFDTLIGLFTVLISLSHENSPAPWAASLLHRDWPTSLAEQQAILERLIGFFEHDAWFSEMASKVAAASSLDWVMEFMPVGIGPTSKEASIDVKWVRDAGRLSESREKKVVLAGSHHVLHYVIVFPHVRKQVLDRLQRQNLTHYDWLPFILGRDFLLNPSPESLADTLEALVSTGGWQPGRDYLALPWQLEPLLLDAESPEELLWHAHRARAGELGTVDDWLAAEQRWLKRDFTVEDLTAFSDAEWPYTGKIATCGIIPTGFFDTDSEYDENNEASLALLQAFTTTTTSRRYRAIIAMSLLHLAGHTYNPAIPFELPLATIKDLVTATNWQVYGLDVLGLMGAEVDWLNEVKTLDVIGNHISVLGNAESGHLVIEEVLMPNVVQQLMPLLGTRNIHEGILRFLAVLTVAGAEVPVPMLDLEKLSPEGQVALVTLNLFGSAPALSAATLTEIVLSLWTHQHPRTSLCELPLVVKQLAERAYLLLTPIAVEVLGNLYNSSLVDARIKTHIIHCYTMQLQHRNSELDNPMRKAELATDWLFEVLSQ